MPFYARPLLPKNQSARALGIFQRADRPPAFRQRHPDFGGEVAGWGGVRHRAGCALLCIWGRFVGEAQGGCACCAIGWRKCALVTEGVQLLRLGLALDLEQGCSRGKLSLL